MIRALASMIVVCLVAATGIHPAFAAHGRRSTLEVSRARVALLARVVEPVARGGTASPTLPPITVVEAAALAAPAASSIDRIAGPRLAVVFRLLSTHSARGPPAV